MSSNDASARLVAIRAMALFARPFGSNTPAVPEEGQSARLVAIAGLRVVPACGPAGVRYQRERSLRPRPFGSNKPPVW